MINAEEIKKRLIDKSITINDVALYIGKSYSTTNLKLKGKTPMTLHEAELIQELLCISDCDFGFYFFSYSRGDKNDNPPHA